MSAPTARSWEYGEKSRASSRPHRVYFVVQENDSKKHGGKYSSAKKKNSNIKNIAM